MLSHYYNSRVESMELSQDTYSIIDVVQNKLLQKVLAAKPGGELEELIGGLTPKGLSKLRKAIRKMHSWLWEKLKTPFFNSMTIALDKPIADQEKFLKFLSNIGFFTLNHEKLLIQAESHPSLRVFFQCVNLLTNSPKQSNSKDAQSKNNWQNKLITLLKSYTSQQAVKARFGSLNEQDQLHLNIFIKTYQYLINPHKYPISEEDIHKYFDLLRDKPYPWLLDLLRYIKSQHLNFVFSDILNARLVLEPSLHFEGNTRYLNKDLLNVESLQLAASKQYNPQWKYTIHAPENVITTEKALYFKYNINIYEICASQFDHSIQDEADADTDEHIENFVNFLAKIASEFDKDWIVMNKEGETKLTTKDKITLLMTNLQIFQQQSIRFMESSQGKPSPKDFVEKNILKNSLAIVDSQLKVKQNAKKAWKLFRVLVNIVVFFIGGTGQASIIAAAQIPESLISILDTYDLPRNQSVLNSIFTLLTDWLDLMIKKSNRPIQGLSTSFTPKLLKAYFQSDELDSNYNSMQGFFNHSKPQTQVIFNQYLMEWLKRLEKPQYSVQNLFLKNYKLRFEVRQQLKKIQKAIESSSLRLQPAVSKLFAARALDYFYILSCFDMANWIRIKKKIEFENGQAIYKKALDQALSILEKEPFSKMSIECILGNVGNELFSDWQIVVDLMTSLNTIIVLNSVKKGDYSEGGFVKLFKMAKVLCKAKAQIDQRIIKGIQTEGIQKFKNFEQNRTIFDHLKFFLKKLSIGLDALKNQQSKTQQLLTLDEQLNYISGFKHLFELLNEKAQKSSIIQYIKFIKIVISSNEESELLSFHMVLNLYVTLKDILFKTLNNLNSQIIDKKKIYDNNVIQIKKLRDYMTYFKSNDAKAFEKDIEIKFSQSVYRLFKLFILRPVGINLHFKYKGVQYPENSSSKMALGMYIDQLDQLVKTVNLDNIQLYNRFIRFYLQQNFFDGLLMSLDKRQNFQHNTRAIRQAMQNLMQLGVGPELARLALSNIEDPDPETALEWIRDNQDQIDNLEREQLARTVRQSSTVRRKQSDADPNTIHEIDLPALGQKMFPHLKRLIKDVLLANLYSESSELIQAMIIQCIERFEKEESRLRNYQGFLEKLTKDFYSSEKKVEGKLTEIDEKRICIDMALLKLIIQKCLTKKKIKQTYLGEFFVQLLNLINFICNSKEINENNQKILQSGVGIIAILMPGKRKSLDQTKIAPQIYAIMSTLLVLTDALPKIKTSARKKSIEDLVVQCIQKSTDIKHKDISQICIEMVFRLIQSETVTSAVSDPIVSMLMNQEQLVEATIQSEIKAYFFVKKSQENTKEGIIKVPKINFLTALEKYAKTERFSKICKSLLKKHHEKSAAYGQKKITNLIYNQNQHKFNESIILKKDFIKFSPNGEIARIIKILVNGIFRKDGISTAHLKILHQVLSRFPLLIPFTLNHPIANPLLDFGGKFLEILIKKSVETDNELWSFMLFMCLRCPIVVQHGSQGNLNLFSSFIQPRILLRLKSFLESMDIANPSAKHSWCILLLCNLLQIREVNNLANVQVSLTDTSSIRTTLEKLMTDLSNSKQVVFVGEALSLIYKELTVTRLQGKYKLYQTLREGSVEEQIIALPLMYGENTNQGDDPLDKGLVEGGDYSEALLMALERRLSREATDILRRRNTDRQGLDFIPIEPESPQKQSKEKSSESEKPKQQIKKQQVVIEGPKEIITLQKHQLVDVDYDYNIRQMSSIQKLATPTNFLGLGPLDTTFEFRPSKPITYEVTRNLTFRSRLSVLMSPLKPTVEPKQSENPQQQQQLAQPPPPLFAHRSRLSRQSSSGGGLDFLRQLPPRVIDRGSLSDNEDQGGDPELLAENSTGPFARIRDLRRVRVELLAERMLFEAERENQRAFIQATMLRNREAEIIERERPPVDDVEIQRALEEYVEPKPPVVEVKEEKKLQVVAEDKKGEYQKKGEQQKKPASQQVPVEPRPIEQVRIEGQSQKSKQTEAKIIEVKTQEKKETDIQAEPNEVQIKNEVKQEGVPAQPEKMEAPKSQFEAKKQEKEVEVIEKQADTKPQTKQHSSQPEEKLILPEVQLKIQVNVQKIAAQEKVPIQEKIVAQEKKVKQERKEQEALEKQVPKESNPLIQEMQKPISATQQPATQASVSQAPPAPAEPPMFRPILEAMNLPQTFLRDNGLEQDLFDSLPENIQIEILASTMQSNPPQPPAHQQGQQNPAIEGEIDQQFLQGLPQQERREILANMQPRNLVNQHVALITSIEDPALRQDILAEATPEVLALLPPEIQAEAEMIRQRRLRELVRDMEEQDIAKETGRVRQKKVPKVYPQIHASLFKQMDEKAALNCLKLLYWTFPKTYKPITIQSILENKLIQPKIITTLLYILRNPLTAKEFPQKIMNWVEDTSNTQQHKPSADVLRDAVLGTILGLFTNCTYKDIKLMKEKIPYVGLCGIILQPIPEYYEKEEDGYLPNVELLGYALDHNIKLATYLLDGVTDLPQPLLRKIVKKLHSPSVEEAFITNLKGLADNPELTRIFAQEVTETHHPKISVYAHLLKYKFSVTKHLSKLHLKALASYKPEYNEFLNQIYRIYTLEELKGIKQLGHYKAIHRNVIRNLLAKRAKLNEEPISLIMKLPFLMDFATKKQIFHHQMKYFGENRYMSRLEIKVNRKDLFRMSYNQIMARTTSELRARLAVSYEQENAYDAGGLTRDWFLSISKEMFNPNYALFETSSSGNTYQPSSKSFINLDHLKYFKFIGRIVGKALAENENIDAFFTRSFYKLILGQDLELSDLEEQDYNFYKSMQYYRENKVEDELTFSYEREKFGTLETIDLVPNGRNIKVNEENKLDFIEKISLAKMRDDIQPQIKAFLEGFHELIPEDSIRFFDAKELELLISGLPNIDLDDLRNNTEYLGGYTAKDNIIKWFWQILETYDQERLAQVIQFITGTSKIPAGGFKALKGIHGEQKISIHKDYDTNHLPQAHTCYNQMELPEYSSKAILEKKLEVAFKWGNESFGFM